MRTGTRFKGPQSSSPQDRRTATTLHSRTPPPTSKGTPPAPSRRTRSLFFLNDTATTEIYTLSLHDALPIYHADRDGRRERRDGVRGAVGGGRDLADHRRERDGDHHGDREGCEREPDSRRHG